MGRASAGGDANRADGVTLLLLPIEVVVGGGGVAAGLGVRSSAPSELDSEGLPQERANAGDGSGDDSSVSEVVLLM